MFTIGGRYYIDIKSNGRSLPIGPNMFDYILVIQNVLQMVPTLTIALRDMSYAFQKEFPFVEGTPISIKIGSQKEDEPPTEMRFRVISTPRISGSGGQQRIKAILDADVLFNTAKGAFTGTASGVISQLAKQAGLQIENDSSNDSMTWLPMGKRLGHFLQTIASHAWADDKSFFVMGLTDKHKLRFRNVNLLQKETPKTLLHFSENPPTAYQSEFVSRILDFSSSSVTGYNNLAFNYNPRTIQERANGVVDEFKDFSLDKLSGFLEMSKRVKQIVDTARVMLTPVDIENTHENFQKARYQNNRGLATFGVKIETLLERSTNLDLLDMAQLYIPRTMGEANDMLNGNYIVTAKTRLIQNNTYCEKLVLASQNRGLDPQGELL